MVKIMKNNFMKALGLCGMVSVLFSCTGTNSGGGKDGQAGKLEQNLSQFNVPADREIPTVFLSLVKTEKTDSSVVYTAKSLNDKDTIGVNVEVINNLPAGIFLDGNPNNDRGFTPGAMKFSSIGSQSDAFVRALAQVYGLPAGGAMTKSTLLPLVFSSNKKVVNLDGTDTYTFKLFF